MSRKIATVGLSSPALESGKADSTDGRNTATLGLQADTTTGFVDIRPLVARDRSGVVRIDAILTGSVQQAYWKRIFREALTPGGDRVRVGLAAEVDGSLAGFLFGDVRAFEFGSEPCGWILEVGVEPHHARRGIGTALLEEACRRFRAAGVSTIRTMVRRNDVPVLTFFRTNGFAGGPYVQLELLDHTPSRDTAARKP